MIFALLTLLSALSLAAVAGWFSIVGFMAIYAGAPMYALIMGVVTECAKLVTTSWLYRNWDYSDWKLKTPLIYFTIALMVATSIGVFGFLSKAHLEQGAGTLDNSSKIEQLQYQIDREKSRIADNEKVTKQLDDTVNSLLGKDRADRALSVRRSQNTQRTQLRADSADAQKQIDVLNKQKFELESEVRKLQLDVGPIRYIAELIYGVEKNADANIASAVRIFTLLLVSTLDPLAVVLLLAANHTLIRLRNEKKEKDKAPQSGFFDNFRRTTAADPKSSPIPSGDGGIQEKEIETHAEVFERTDIPTSGTRIQEAEMDVASPQGPVEVLNEEIVNPTGNTDISETPPENDGSWEAPPNGENLSLPEDAPILGESEIEQNKATEDEVTRTELQAEIPSGGGLLNENKADDLEKFTRIPVEVYPSAVLRTPSPSRIVDIEQHGTEETVPTEVSTTKVPWAQQDNVLREIIGQFPHFSPLKVNEENKEITNTLSKTVSEEAAKSETAPEAGGEEIKTVSPGGPEASPSENEDTNVDTESLGVAANDKYPKALSWLTEFRRM